MKKILLLCSGLSWAYLQAQTPAKIETLEILDYACEYPEFLWSSPHSDYKRPLRDPELSFGDAHEANLGAHVPGAPIGGGSYIQQPSIVRPSGFSYSDHGLRWQSPNGAITIDVGLGGVPSSVSNFHFSDLFKDPYQVAMERLPRVATYSPVVPEEDVASGCAVEKKKVEDNYAKILTARSQQAAAMYALRRKGDKRPQVLYAEAPRDVERNVANEKATALKKLADECAVKGQKERDKEHKEMDDHIAALQKELSELQNDARLSDLRQQADALEDEVKQRLLIRDLEQKLAILRAVDDALSQAAAPHNAVSHAPSYDVNGRPLVNLHSVEYRYSQVAEGAEDYMLEQAFIGQKGQKATVSPQEAALENPTERPASPLFADEQDGSYQATWDRYQVGDEEVLIAWYEHTGALPEGTFGEFGQDGTVSYGDMELSGPRWEYTGALETDPEALAVDESWAQQARQVAADIVFNVGDIRDAWRYIAETQSDDPWVTKYLGVPVAGMAIVGGAVDAATNVATLGLKSLAGAANKGIAQGTKSAMEKFIAKEAAEGAMKTETIAARSFTKATVGDKVLLKPHAKALFKGREVRAVRSLEHLNEAELRRMIERGTAPMTTKSEPLHLHHIGQKEQKLYAEVPKPLHNVYNSKQHPFGNQKGKGLTPQERADFDKFKRHYWKARAREELIKRGIEP